MKTYLMFDGKYYKIGQSKCPEKRLKSIRTSNPEIKLLAYGEHFSEKELHAIFRNKRINGEWYKLKNDEVCKIIKLLHNEYSGINQYRMNQYEQKIKKREQEDDRIFKKYSKYKITFGKYKNNMITDMNNIDELKYIEWCIRVFKNKKSNTIKIFKWWIRQHKASL